MFGDCKSLKYVNISNLDTTDANKFNMFGFCESLKKENVITKDQKILDNFEELGGGQKAAKQEEGEEGEGAEEGGEEY